MKISSEVITISSLEVIFTFRDTVVSNDAETAGNETQLFVDCILIIFGCGNWK